MSVGSIVQNIYDRLNYNPKLRGYKNHVLAILNEHYIPICGVGPWRFLQRSVDFDIYPDITGSASSLMGVNVAGAEPRELVPPTSDLFQPYMEGATFHGFYGSTSTTPDDSFKIARVDTSGVGNVAYLDKNWPYSGVATSEWRIEFRDYYLPADCAEILGLNDIDNERGRLVAIDRRRAEKEFLGRRDTGDAVVWYEGDKAFIDPPVEAISLSQSAGAGLKTTRTYEYFYTFRRLGIESPPSPSAMIKLTGSNGTVNLGSMLDTRVDPTGASSLTATAGTQKLIYRRDVTADGPWNHIATLEDATVAYTDNAILNTALYRSHQEVERHQQSEGRKKITIWWTPARQQTLELRYLVRPERLHYKAQQTLLPEGYEKMLIDFVLGDILSRVGDKSGAQIHTRRAEEKLERLRLKELNLPDQVHRMKRFDARTPGADGPWGRNFGIPSIS